MNTSMGEYIVGAYLQQILKCDVVDYNVRPPDGGLSGLAEFDVIGLKFSESTAYLCEVTTHLGGIDYGGYQVTLEKIKDKHQRQRWYAENYLSNFDRVRYMFWAPVVPRGFLTEELNKIEGFELVINARYKACVGELRELAGGSTRDVGNPFFRSLQIIEHLRD